MRHLLQHPGITRGILFGALLVCIAALSSCGSNVEMASQAQAVPGGNAEQGRLAIQRYGCGSCHTIAGVPGADGLVGPPLNGIGYRAYVAGMLQNTPDNMIRWIQDPQAVVPGNAMPNLDVPESDARDITAYLYTTRLDR